MTMTTPATVDASGPTDDRPIVLEARGSPSTSAAWLR